LRSNAYVLSVAAMVAAWSSAGATHAVDAPTVAPGERTLTLNGHHDFDAAEVLDGAGEHVIELGYAPAARWKTTVGWLWAQAPGGSLESNAVTWENLFQLTPAAHEGAGLGLLVKYGRELDGGADALEVALLAEKRAGRANLVVNLLAVRDLERGAATALGYSFAVSTSVAPGLDLGLEWYGEFGEWRGLGRLGERAHQAGPMLYGEIATAGGAFRYEGGVLFGVTAAAPDTTLRLQVEYAFE
jgi:hypothetical protein